MNINTINKHIKRNAPTLLTGLGVIGVVGTTISGIKATPKALQILEMENEYKLELEGEELDIFEKALLVTPIYLPTILLGLGTISCILGANHINRNRQAALTSAYACLNTSFNEYKNKVNEVYGDGANDKIETEIAKDNLTPTDKTYLGETKLFYDKISKRYFESTIYNLQNAIYQLNKIYAIDGDVSLNEFYKLIGIDTTVDGDIIGWNGVNQWEFIGYVWIDIEWKLMDMPDDLECYILEYNVEPTIDYTCY